MGGYTWGLILKSLKGKYEHCFGDTSLCSITNIQKKFFSHQILKDVLISEIILPQKLCVLVPFSVRSLLKESVFERPGSEMTLEPSLTVRLMDW